MAQNKERPNVFVTAICENVLEEKDGVLSAIRFIDRVRTKIRNASLYNRLVFIGGPRCSIIGGKLW